jgi:diguanylate cyclase (GGDEF)-like protein
MVLPGGPEHDAAERRHQEAATMGTSSRSPGDTEGQEPIDTAWACRRLQERLGATRVAVWEYNALADQVSPIVSASAAEVPDTDDTEGGRHWLRTPLPAIPAMQSALAEQQPVIVEDAGSDRDLPPALVADFGLTSLRIIPLVTDEPVGVVAVEPATAGTGEDIRALLGLVSLTVGQAAARRQVQHQRRQAELLLALTEVGASAGTPNDVLGEICQRLAAHARMNRACLWLVEDGELRPRMASYADGHQDPRAWDEFRSSKRPLPLVDQALASGAPAMVEDRASPLLPAWWAETFGIGSILAVPVGAAPDIIGILTLDDPDPRTFSPDLQRLVAAAGAHVDGLIARARGEEERNWHLRTHAAIRDLLQGGAKATTVRFAGQLLAEVAADAFDADHALFLRYHDGRIDAVETFGLDQERARQVTDRLVGSRLADHEVWARSLRHSEPQAIDVADPIPLEDDLVDLLSLRSCAVLPLRTDRGCLGVVHLGNTHRRWRDYHVTLAEQLSLEAKLVVDNVLLREKERERLAELAHHATHDALTGLPNRGLLEDRLEQAFRQPRHAPHEVALLFVDLDRFKQINDRIGHVAADRLLQEVAERLTRCVRAEDTVARFAGDEFVILLKHVEGAHEAEVVAERIRTVLAEPIVVSGNEVVVTASVGIANGTPDSGDADRLLRSADAAMYRVKRSGRGRHAVYDEALDVLSERSLGLEADLHRALDRGELSLRFQPIVDLDECAIHGFESLLRWEHPEEGMIPPLDFIPLAEATGTIFPIGRWVIEEACRQLGEWRRAHPEHDLFVSVNLSALQIHDEGLVGQVEHALSANGVPPRALLLELTESSLIREEGLPTLTHLHDLGVRIAIDDFGTGYSALGYLQRFPIDVLKVDRSFVNELGGETDGALARTVVAVAKSLGVDTIAEGIEHLSQLEELRRLGSQMGQGYHFAAPLSLEDAERWLRGDRSPHLADQLSTAR